MQTRLRRILGSLTLALALLAGQVAPAPAVDGVVPINQNRALAGGVTPGDAPGFPVTISEPGSYRLTSSLIVPDANTTAIEITSGNVTLDLNGFSIIGAFARGVGHGVDASGSSNVAVINGTVVGAGSIGIRIGEFSRVENVRVLFSVSGNGIEVSDHGIVRNSTASSNADNGIVVRALPPNGAMITGNTTNGNTGSGIDCGGAIVALSGNTIDGNRRSGISCAGVIAGNTVSSNNSDGIVCGACLLSGNSVTSNGGFGLNPGSNSEETLLFRNVLTNNTGGAFNPLQGGFIVTLQNSLCGATKC